MNMKWMMKRKEEWRNKMKEKNGWFTILMLLTLTAMFPIFLFFFVELNYYYAEKDQAVDIADNISSSAVRSLDTYLELENGVYVEKYEINDTEAQTVARELFKANYSLNDDLTPTTHSHQQSNPTLKVYTVNQSGSFTTDEGFQWNVTRPTVIVYTATQPKGLFFNKLVTLQTYSVFEVEAIAEPTPPIETPANTIVINRTIYDTSFTIQGNTINGQIIQDKVQGQTTNEIWLSDGSKGTFEFTQSRRANFTMTVNGQPISGVLTLGNGSNQNDMSGNHTFTINSYPGTYNANFTFFSKENIQTGDNFPTPPTVKNEYRFHKQYLTN